MKTTAKRYQPALSQQHEDKLQELRHERKTESLHLDGLKKALQSKLSDLEEDKRRAA